MPRPIFVAATRQHVGKTTVSLALMSGLKKVRAIAAARAAAELIARAFAPEAGTARVLA